MPRLTPHAITGARHSLGRRVLATVAGAAALSVAGLAVVPTAGASAAHPSRPAAHPAASGTGAVQRTLPAPTQPLQQITNFGFNPTNLGMYAYVPANVKPHPALIVAMHFCGGTGPAFFNGTEFASLADIYGFVVIYPSVPTTRAPFDCFDASTPAALTHNGDSDPAGIMSMVQWAEQNLNVNPHRLFVTGLSSGAMETNVMMADYPNVFKAGSIMSGVAFGCFATTNGVLWNQNCASGQVTHTGQEWGDMVRAADPGYHGPRPRVQIWHGTADTILLYPNFGQEVAEWTNVLGAHQVLQDSPMPTWTHTVYAGPGGIVDTYSVAGEDHNLGFHFPDWAQYAIAFFGLAPFPGQVSAGARPATG